MIPDPSAAQGGAVFNPTSAQAAPGWEPSTTALRAEPLRPARPAVRASRQYGQQYGQPPYGQPGYGQQQPPYGQPYQQPPTASPPTATRRRAASPVRRWPRATRRTPPSRPPRPDHPQSTLALVLGIVGLVFGFSCGVGFLASPFAWALGRNAVKEIQASHGRLGGEGTAKAGMITGIVGTVLLVLGVLLLIGFAILIAVSDTTTGSNV